MTTADRVQRCPVHDDFDPLSSEYQADPHAVFARLPPHQGPVFYAPVLDYYVVTGYAEIEQVFLDNGTYSAANAQLPLVPIVPEAQSRNFLRAKVAELADAQDSGPPPTPSLPSVRRTSLNLRASADAS